MEKNNVFYYCILFYILYVKIYYVLCDVISSVLLFFRANIYLIPILLFLTTIGMLLLFLCIKKLPPIKLWVLIFVLLISILMNYFNLPDRFFLRTSSFYKIDQRMKISTFIFSCKSIFYYGIIVISCFKYFRDTNAKRVEAKEKD